MEEEITQEQYQAFAERTIRAVEVTVGDVKGWQVQTRAEHDGPWRGCNVMCDQATAQADVERRRTALINVLKE